jgi:hypothetical protein
MKFDGYSRDNAKKDWSRMGRNRDINVTVASYKFPGASGPDTPVATFSQLLEILPYFPGNRAKQLGA